MSDLVLRCQEKLRMIFAKKRREADFKSVLFICSGNHFRSRFAEAVFNCEADRRGIPWRAFSRGLSTGMTKRDLSSLVKRGLAARGIKRSYIAPRKVQLSEEDLLRAQHIIALDNAEHRPMIAAQFPDWVNRVTYWDVPDRRITQPAVIMAAIEQKVIAQIDWLTGPNYPYPV